MTNNTAYGVDLAGYSSKGKSQVAQVTRVDAQDSCYLRAALIPTNLLQEYKGNRHFFDVIKSDVQVFSGLLSDGGLCAVDVPIDLQGLNEFSGEKEYIWETTRRPIDYKLGALPPLADKIGAVVTRMKLIMNHFPDTLGKSIFETYPAATLALLKTKLQYKGGLAQWHKGIWLEPLGTPPNAANKGLAEILNGLNFVCDMDGIYLNDDQLDAILSAVPLLNQPWLTETDLLKHPMIKAEYLRTAPKGYVLCGDRFWSRIEIQ